MKHKPSLRQCLRPTFWLVLGSCAFLAVTSQASDPNWWHSRGAVSTAAPNQYAVVNQGQLKQFTVKAVQELNADLAGGAGTSLNTLVTAWQQDYATHHYGTDTNNPSRPYKPADFQAVTVGQLKYIGGLIRESLQRAGYSYFSPSWIRVNPGADGAVALVGQLKTVFNIDLSTDSNGLPALWEEYYFGHTGLNPTSTPDGDGMTLMQKYAQGVAPGQKNNPTVQLVVNVIVR